MTPHLAQGTPTATRAEGHLWAGAGPFRCKAQLRKGWQDAGSPGTGEPGIPPVWYREYHNRYARGSPRRDAAFFQIKKWSVALGDERPVVVQSPRGLARWPPTASTAARRSHVGRIRPRLGHGAPAHR